MSQGEDDTVVMGRAFMNCSISHSKVLKVSSLRALDTRMTYREFLTLRMIRSQTRSVKALNTLNTMWCIGGVDLRRCLVVSKNLIHRGAVEGGHPFFFCCFNVRCVVRADFRRGASSCNEAAEGC